MVEATVPTWGDITKEAEEMQIEALKEAYEELKEMYGENIHFRAIRCRREPTPHLHCDLCRWLWGIYRRKTIGDKKKMRRTQEKFLEARKGASRQICTFGAGEIII